MEKMRVAIYGAGALGTVLGAYISKNAKRSGVDLGDGIELYNRNKAHIAALKKNEAKITGTVEFSQKVKAYLPEEMTGLFDYIFLMTKQLDNENTVVFLKDYLKENGALCTMQNGLPEPQIGEIIGNDRVLGCAIGWGATMGEPGSSVLTSSPDSLCFALGAISEGGKRHLEPVKAVLELMGPVSVEENFIGARWSKLLINAAFSGMSIVIGDTFGAVCDNRKARRCAQAIIKECIDVSRAAGVTVEPVQGKDIVKLFDFRDPVKKVISRMLIPIAMKKHRGITASMLTDYRNGKPCEIDAINGVVCREGDKAGIETPFCDKVVEIVHGYEKGKGKPSLESLEAFDSLFLG